MNLDQLYFKCFFEGGFVLMKKREGIRERKRISPNIDKKEKNKTTKKKWFFFGVFFFL